MTEEPKAVHLTRADIKPMRELIAEEQHNICPMCQRPLDNPCLDHFHRERLGGTGHVRGVLCRGCNALLGKIENNCRRNKVPLEMLPVVLANTALYLQKEPHPLLFPAKPTKNKRKGKKKK